MIDDNWEVPIAIGQLRITHNAFNGLHLRDIVRGLLRHVSSDWGELDPIDWNHNQRAVENGERLQSRYTGICGTEFWIITEGDRKLTTILLPDEY